LGWTLVLSIPEQEFLGPINEIQNTLITIMAASIAAVIVISLLLIRELVPPIKKIERAAKDISEGKFIEKLEIPGSRDEITSLGESIYEMSTKLKNAGKEKEEFVAMITHDLKQPLVPISGNAELLKNPKMGELNDMQRDCVDQIISNVSLQLSMIDNLVSAQKLGAGAMKYDIEELSTKDILNECIKTHSPAMTDKNIDLFSLSTMDVKIKGDNRRIQESFTNLVLNAHDFVPQNGKIEVGFTDGKKEVTFFVKDDGEGIPKEKQDQLFKKYGQVKTDAKRTFGGTGLGLAVSQQLVEGMGGKIWLESEAGKGTTFFFTIPKEKV